MGPPVRSRFDSNLFMNKIESALIFTCRYGTLFEPVSSAGPGRKDGFSGGPTPSRENDASAEPAEAQQGTLFSVPELGCSRPSALAARRRPARRRDAAGSG